jgi:hypothetical protein
MTDYGTTGTDPVAWDASSEQPSSSGATATAVEQTKAVAGTAVDQTRVVADEAKEQARRLGQEARSQLRGQVDDQAGRLANGLGDMGHQLRTMAENADDPESPVTRLTHQAADNVERLASRLDDGGLDVVIEDVKRFARNRPGLFLAAALGAGFVVGRLIKAIDIGEVVKSDGPPSGNGSGVGSPGAAAVVESPIPPPAPTSSYDQGVAIDEGLPPVGDESGWSGADD